MSPRDRPRAADEAREQPRRSSSGGDARPVVGDDQLRRAVGQWARAGRDTRPRRRVTQRVLDQVRSRRAGDRLDCPPRAWVAHRARAHDRGSRAPARWRPRSRCRRGRAARARGSSPHRRGPAAADRRPAGASAVGRAQRRLGRLEARAARASRRAARGSRARWSAASAVRARHRRRTRAGARAWSRVSLRASLSEASMPLSVRDSSATSSSAIGCGKGVVGVAGPLDLACGRGQLGDRRHRAACHKRPGAERERAADQHGKPQISSRFAISPASWVTGRPYWTMIALPPPGPKFTPKVATR